MDEPNVHVIQECKLVSLDLVPEDQLLWPAPVGRFEITDVEHRFTCDEREAGCDD